MGERATWTEQHEASPSRVVLTDLAQQWAFEQVGRRDRVMSSVAARLGVHWHTNMTQVVDRGAPLADDPDRLTGVTRSGSTRPRSCVRRARHTQYATGIADLARARRGSWTSFRAAPAGSRATG